MSNAVGSTPYSLGFQDGLQGEVQLSIPEIRKRIGSTLGIPYVHGYSNGKKSREGKSS